MKKLRIIIKFLSLVILNGDFLTLFKAIGSGNAKVSSLATKNLCVPGLNCYSCPSAIGACPIGSLQFYLNDVSLRIQLKDKINLAGLYIAGFFLGTGVIGGRIYCGWICPFGTIQELINRITGKNRKVPQLLEKGRFITLTVFVFIMPLFLYNITMLSPWFCKLICPAGTLTAGIPLLIIDESLRASVSFITIVKFSILIFLIAALLFSDRVFCKTLCPLGALWGIFNKISILNISFDKEKCVNCSKCSGACPMNLEAMNEFSTGKCIRCLKCTNICPTDSLKFKIFQGE